MRLSQFLVTVLLAVSAHAANFVPQIPSVQSFYPDELGHLFNLSPGTRILVDEAYASDCGSQSDGPTLLDFAVTFRSDLMDVTSFTLPRVQVTPFSQTHSISNDGSAIVLTLSSPSNHTLYSGAPTPEAYDFLISNSSYIIWIWVDWRVVGNKDTAATTRAFRAKIQWNIYYSSRERL